VRSSALVTGSLFEVLRGLANLWALGLVLAVAATLTWFVYSVFLKRLLRVRRIANIRLRRMLEERKRFEN
jgi:drug/metabolite transporter (DMT)-like permease